jgi:hypothetical protein
MFGVRAEAAGLAIRLLRCLLSDVRANRFQMHAHSCQFAAKLLRRCRFYVRRSRSAVRLFSSQCSLPRPKWPHFSVPDGTNPEHTGPRKFAQPRFSPPHRTNPCARAFSTLQHARTQETYSPRLHTTALQISPMRPSHYRMPPSRETSE